MATQPRIDFTLAEYLDLERTADSRSEFVAGNICAMAGGTEAHARLCSELVFILRSRLNKRCRVYGSDLKVYIKQHDQCVYPDVMVICGEPQFLDQRRDVVTNPSLVVEVLSPSTKNYDLSTKSVYYRSLPSLRHCLLISQESFFSEHSWFQETGKWLVTQNSNPQDVIQLLSLGIEISLSEIYGFEPETGQSGLTPPQ